jgi:hypothetical protein
MAQYFYEISKKKEKRTISKEDYNKMIKERKEKKKPQEHKEITKLLVKLEGLQDLFDDSKSLPPKKLVGFLG